MPDPPEPSFRDEGRRPEGRVKKSAGMIAPANVCAHNHHKRASEGNGPAAVRPRGAHLLAMEPRLSGCQTSRSRAFGTKVRGRKDG
ncbi:hypothetical protein PIB30_106192 [Stylosanthes scabra]|uniref:Uncharacterized protein n=1 Tax=Stylosanthes scabra TaxID=79078 RepID=A0ABU6ZXF5_9FABA|nr:hypothetical protein [Stylosanthes scabra]